MSTDSVKANSELLDLLTTNLSNSLERSGFEIAPFLTGWYNAVVTPRLRFDATLSPHDDCLAFCIISTPQMFELSFLRDVQTWFDNSSNNSVQQYLKSLSSNGSGYRFIPSSKDPFDWSVLLTLHNTLQLVTSDLPRCLSFSESEALKSAQWIPDFAIRPVTRLPYVHVQSAGHVSGMAFFHHFERPNFTNDKIHQGLSLHPIYGGWFGFRGVYVFPNLRCPYLPEVDPVSPIYPGRPPFPPEKLDELFSEYNERVRENKWRDFGLCDSIQYRYSSAAQTYFSTPPSSRNNLLEVWFSANNDANSELTAI